MLHASSKKKKEWQEQTRTEQAICLFGMIRATAYTLVQIQRQKQTWKPALFQKQFILDFRFQSTDRQLFLPAKQQDKKITQKKNTLSTFFANSDFSTMATLKTIKEAIAALKDRTGSSVIAINKWIETEKKVSQS